MRLLNCRRNSKICRSLIAVGFLTISSPAIADDLALDSSLPSLQTLFMHPRHKLKCGEKVYDECYDLVVFDRIAQQAMTAIAGRFEGRELVFSDNVEPGTKAYPIIGPDHLRIIAKCIELGCGSFGDIDKEIREKVAQNVTTTMGVFECILTNHSYASIEVRMEKFRLRGSDAPIHKQRYLRSYPNCIKGIGERHIYIYKMIQK